MRSTLLTIAAGALALTGCTAQPVEIPADMAEAAKTCFVVQALNLRDQNNRSQDDPITITEYSKAVQYSMIAASKAEDFSIDTVLGALPNVETMVKELGTRDYKAALPVCQKRFGIAAKGPAPALPERDLDAGMACYAMSQFFMGGIEGDDVDTQGKKPFYTDLNKRLETTLDGLINADPATLASFTSQEGAQAMVTQGLKEAFSKGDPQAYLAACDTRFPAQ